MRPNISIFLNIADGLHVKNRIKQSSWVTERDISLDSQDTPLCLGRNVIGLISGPVAFTCSIHLLQLFKTSVFCRNQYMSISLTRMTLKNLEVQLIILVLLG